MHLNNMCLFFFPYYSIFVGLMFTAYILYLTFAPPVVWNFVFFGILLVGIAAAALVFTAVYHMGNAIMGVLKFKKSTRCRVQSIIYLFVVAVCGYAPRVLVMFVGWDHDIMLCAILGGLSLPIFVHLIFIGPLECEAFYIIKSKFLYISYGIHIVLLIASMRLGMAISHTLWDSVITMATQIVFTPLCAVATTDMVLTLMGVTQFRVGHASHTQVAPLKVEALQTPGRYERSNLECRICRSEYSTERIPLILRECGHTVCQICCDKMISRFSNMYVQCPFCQLLTIVRTTPLVKNYMLWDLIQELKKKDC